MVTRAVWWRRGARVTGGRVRRLWWWKGVWKLDGERGAGGEGEVEGWLVGMEGDIMVVCREDRTADQSAMSMRWRVRDIGR